MQELKGIYVNSQGENACSYYRGYLPALHCGKALAGEVDVVYSEELQGGSKYKAYIFHRIANGEFLPELLRLKGQGSRIIWDLDDNLWNIPDWSSVKRGFTRPKLDVLDFTLKLADFITVSTEQLKCVIADRFSAMGSRFADKIFVMPNLIDIKEFGRAPTFNKSTKDAECIRILWAGSPTHEIDLRVADDLLFSIEQINVNAKVYFFGYMPEYFERYNFCIPIPPVKMRYYSEVLHALSPMIGIAPLCGHPFNNSKSNIKALEYACAGAVPVCSASAAYDIMPLPLIDYNEWDWKSKIERIVLNPEKYYNSELSDSIEYFSWNESSDLRQRWINFYELIGS